MRSFLISLFFLSLFLFAGCILVKGQSKYTRYNELQVGDGVLSRNQLLGFSSRTSGYMSYPALLTGAAFLTYRRYFTEKLVVGITMGLDNQLGKLSYGREYGGRTGVYDRKAYTIATEILLPYTNKDGLILYGFLGMGYTDLKETFTFNNGIRDPWRFYGTPGSLVPANPFTDNRNHFSTQVTPLGFKSTGDFGCFLELGYGYKGIVCMGLLCRFDNGKHRLAARKLPITDEVILLPSSFPLDSNVKYMGTVKTGVRSHPAASGFDDKLDIAREKTMKKYGNVFRLVTINDEAYKGHYDIKGEAWYAKDYSDFKRSAETEKNKKFADGKIAYITIYQPDYNHAENDSINSELTINDSIYVRVNAFSKHVFRITKAGRYTIRNSADKRVVSFDIKLGEDYYLKNSFESPPGKLSDRVSVIAPVSQLQGYLESSVIWKVHSYDITAPEQ